MGVLSCRTPAMAVKEIWAYLLAYNCGWRGFNGAIRPARSGWVDCFR